MMEINNELNYYKIINFHPVSTGTEITVYKHQMGKNY